MLRHIKVLAGIALFRCLGRHRAWPTTTSATSRDAVLTLSAATNYRFNLLAKGCPQSRRIFRTVAPPPCSLGSISLCVITVSHSLSNRGAIGRQFLPGKSAKRIRDGRNLKHMQHRRTRQTFRSECPAAFARSRTSAPNFAGCKEFREKSNFPVTVLKTPLPEKA